MSKPTIVTMRKGFNKDTSPARRRTLDGTKNHNKVAMQGRGSVSFEAREEGSAYQRQHVDLVHNLGYQPFVKIWAKSASTDWAENPVFNTGTTGPTSWVSGISRIDENTIRLYFYIWDFTKPAYSAFNVSYRYVIYTDPVKDPWYV